MYLFLVVILVFDLRMFIQHSYSLVCFLLCTCLCAGACSGSQFPHTWGE